MPTCYVSMKDTDECIHCYKQRVSEAIDDVCNKTETKFVGWLIKERLGL